MMVTREKLLRTYWRMERAVAPDIRYAQLTYEDRLQRHVQHEMSWLDLGCGRRILPEWRRDVEGTLASRSKRVVGVDIDEDALRDNGSIDLKCRADATRLPFADGAFDLVTANMVVEHLEHPAPQFREIARVIRTGGVFMIHTPNSMGYPVLLGRIVPSWIKSRLARHLDFRESHDVHRTFYRANSRRRLRALARGSSLNVLDVEFVRTTPLFGLVPPIAFVELLWSRALNNERLKYLRSNIIAVLQKLDPAPSPPAA